MRIAPGLPHAYHTLGLIYEETGQASKALKLWMMAAHLSKRDVQQWQNLFHLSKQHGEVQQSIYCLQRILAIKPDDQEAQWEYALLQSETGEHRKAARALLPLLRNNPGDAHVIHRLVHSYHRLGHPAKAIHLLEALLTPARCGADATTASAPAAASGAAAPPIDLHSLNMLLELYMESGRFRDALARLAQWRAAVVAPLDAAAGDMDGDPGAGGPADERVPYPMEIRVKEGACLAYLGELAKAEELWQPLLRRAERVGEYGDQLYEVALTYYNLHLWARALNLFEQLGSSALYGGTLDMKIGPRRPPARPCWRPSLLPRRPWRARAARAARPAPDARLPHLR